MNYVQLGIAVWLELARRRAKERDEEVAEEVLSELITDPDKASEKIKGSSMIRLSIIHHLTDVAEDLLKMVKP